MLIAPFLNEKKASVSLKPGKRSLFSQLTNYNLINAFTTSFLFCMTKSNACLLSSNANS